MIPINCSPYSIIKVNVSICSLKTRKEKPGDGEQRDELESDLTEVASQAEESPPGTPAEDKMPTQHQENLKEEITAEPQKTLSQPSPARTQSWRRRPPKTTPVSTQKKVSVKKEEESAAQEVPEFQDDPSDTDYTPSKDIFVTKC